RRGRAGAPAAQAGAARRPGGGARRRRARGGRLRSAPPAAEAVGASAGHRPARRRRRTVSPSWGALAPLTVVIIAFFVIPICGMVTTSVLVPGPERGSSVLSAEN